MACREILAGLAAVAVLSGATTARAQDAASMLSLAPPQQYGEDSPRLAQNELSKYSGIGNTINEYDLKLTGHVAAGYTFNFVRPPGGLNGPGRIFDDKSDDLRLNQLDLKLARDIPFSADRFDMGFTVEAIFGADARFTQANGTNFYGSGFANQRRLDFFFAGQQPTNFIFSTGFPGQPDPENQIDFLQADVKFNLPVGEGVILTAGKFVAPFGYESIDPTKNLFYSHSFIFGLSQPRTLTGITASTPIAEHWTMMGGVVVGWDQSLEDNNSAPSFILQGGYKSPEAWDFTVTTLFGPEQNDEDSDWRFIVDATMHWWTHDYSFGVEGLIGFEPNVGTTITGVDAGAGLADLLEFTGDDAWWFGGAIYATWHFDDTKHFALNGRVEFFNDHDGGRQVAAEIFSGTLGLIILPFPDDEVGKNLMIRPEIRLDYSDEDIFDGGGGIFNEGRKSQITLGADAIFRF